MGEYYRTALLVVVGVIWLVELRLAIQGVRTLGSGLSTRLGHLTGHLLRFGIFSAAALAVYLRVIWSFPLLALALGLLANRTGRSFHRGFLESYSADRQGAKTIAAVLAFCYGAMIFGLPMFLLVMDAAQNWGGS